MSLLTFQTNCLRLEVLPEAGTSIVSFAGRFRGKWVPLLRPTPDEAVTALNPSLMSSFTMAPWCNPVKDARFVFRDRLYSLRPTTAEGHAQHGDVRRRPWKVFRQSPAALACSIDSRDFPDFNFPFPLACKIQYELAANSLSVKMTLANVGDLAMPCGFGFHPYFNRSWGGKGDDDVQLQFKVSGVYPRSLEDPMITITPEPGFCHCDRYGRTRHRRLLWRLDRLGEDFLSLCARGSAGDR